MTTIKDGVHDHIEVGGIGAELMETPQVQRLRRVKQLGTVPLVYPSANHSRFEHSLGVYELTERALDVLDVPEAKGRAVRAAALLHDVGHTPYSHALESLLQRYTGHTHEDVSQLLENGHVAEILESHSVDPDRVAALISGKGTLGQLLAGELDVDRMDYLPRDALHTGLPYGRIDIERLLRALQIVDGNVVLAEGNVQTAESLLMARSLMNRTVYYHHVTRITKAMLQRATLRLLESGDKKATTVARMDDSELWVAIQEVEDAQPLAKRLANRELYKRALWSEYGDVGQKRVDELLGTDSKSLRAIEADIADEAGVARDAVLLDVQGLPEMEESTTKVTVNGDIRALSDQSTLVEALERAQLEQWRLGVYTPPDHVDSVGAAAEKVLGLDIDGERIAETDSPGRYASLSDFTS